MNIAEKHKTQISQILNEQPVDLTENRPVEFLFRRSDRLSRGDTHGVWWTPRLCLIQGEYGSTQGRTYMLPIAYPLLCELVQAGEVEAEQPHSMEVETENFFVQYRFRSRIPGHLARIVPGVYIALAQEYLREQLGSVWFIDPLYKETNDLVISQKIGRVLVGCQSQKRVVSQHWAQPNA